MKESIEQMRTRHLEEIELLQANCRHAKKSDWLPYAWAPGHYCGNVIVCECCGKILSKDWDENPAVFNVKEQGTDAKDNT